MANKKINDLALAGGISSTMQLETDISGTTANRITITQLDGRYQTNHFILKNDINLPADFPTPAVVAIGQVYSILTNVTDNDPTKTNTGQSFLAGDEILWNGTNWTPFGGSAVASLWVDNLINLTPATSGRGIDLPGSGNLINIGTETETATPAVTIISNASGFADPSNVDLASDGDKWVFWNKSYYKGAIGFSARTMWFQSTDTSATPNRFKWYGGSAGTPVEILAVGDIEGFQFNATRVDMDFTIFKATSGEAYKYDFGLGTHTFTGAVTCNSDFSIVDPSDGDIFRFSPDPSSVILWLQNDKTTTAGTILALSNIDNDGSNYISTRYYALGIKGSITDTSTLTVGFDPSFGHIIESANSGTGYLFPLKIFMGAYLPLTFNIDGTMTGGGVLDMGANKVTSTYVPFNDEDLCNKLYVDTTDNRINNYLSSPSLIYPTSQDFNGTEYNVNDEASLIAAIAAASNGDIINLTADITLTSTLIVDKTLKIDGAFILQSAGGAGDPVNLINITANNVYITSNITIKHRKTTNTSVESAITLNNATGLVSNASVEFMEFGYICRGSFSIGGHISYTGVASNSNRAIAIYKLAADSQVNTVLWDFVDNATPVSNFIFISYTGVGDNVDYNLKVTNCFQNIITQRSRQFIFYEVLSKTPGATPSLIAENNKFNCLNGDIGFTFTTTQDISYFDFIALFNNWAGSAGYDTGSYKGLCFCDGSGTLRSLGTTNLYVSGNVNYPVIRSSNDYSIAIGQSVFNYKNTLFTNDVPLEKQTNVFVKNSQYNWLKTIDDTTDRMYIIDDKFYNGLQYPTGFPALTDSELLYNDGTQTITLQPKAPATSFSYYLRGIKYTVSSAQNKTHAATTGIYYLYYDSTNTLQFSLTPWNLLTDVPVSYVIYNATLADGFHNEDRHGSKGNPSEHLELHEQIGTYIIDGFAIADYVVQPVSPVDSDNQFSLTSGNIADEDLRTALSALTAAGPYSVWYRLGASGEWRWDTTKTLPFYNGTYIQYNQYTGGAWQLTDLDNNNYVNMWVFKVPAITGVYQTVIVVGQSVYTTLVAAQAAPVSGIQWGTLPFQEIAPLYRVIFRTSASYTNTGKCRIAATAERLIGTRATITGGTQANHNALVGLQAAALGVTWGHISDQTQTIAGNKTLSGTLDVGANKVTSTYVPLNDEDLCNKLYVDNISPDIYWERSMNVVYLINDGDGLSLSGALLIESGANIFEIYHDGTNSELWLSNNLNTDSTTLCMSNISASGTCDIKTKYYGVGKYSAQTNTETLEVGYFTDVDEFGARVANTGSGTLRNYAIAVGSYKHTFGTDGSTILAGNVTIGTGAVGVDYALDFNGETNDGQIKWFEDEDMFAITGSVNIKSPDFLELQAAADKKIHLLGRTNYHLVIYNQTASEPIYCSLMPYTNDGTATAEYRVYGAGYESGTDNEYISLGSANSVYSLATHQTGIGTLQPLIIDATGTTSYQLYLKTDGSIGIGTNNPAADLDMTKSKSGSTLSGFIKNSSNTANSNATFIVASGGTSGGDAAYLVGVDGTTYYYMGIDNSDGDKFEIGYGATIGSSPKIIIDSVNDRIGFWNATPIGSSDVDIAKTKVGSSVRLDVRNLDNTNDLSEASIVISTGGPSGGNPILIFDIEGVIDWVIGVDNTDNNLKIGGDVNLNSFYLSLGSSFINPGGAGGSISTGDATYYWNDISYKTLTDRGCLGWFDEGVEMPDGTIVSDLEAFTRIEKDEAKTTIYGKPMLNYKSFPKVAYQKAKSMGQELARDENDEPIGGMDGIEMTSIFSIMIGAFKEISAKLTALDNRLKALESV